MRGVLSTADSSCVLGIVALQYTSTNNRCPRWLRNL